MAASRKVAVSQARLSTLLAPRAGKHGTTLLRRHGFREPARAQVAIRRLYSDEFQRRNLAKIFPNLIRACRRSADPDRALLKFEQLVAALPNPNIFYHYLREAPERLELLVKIFAHSEALADTLARNAEHFHFLIAPETLREPREKAWLGAEIIRLLLPIRVSAQKYDVVRRFRRRETLRIGARDLIGRASVEETTRELSNLADVCLQAVFEVALDKLAGDLKARATCFAIIGMGKLGGQDLNYSSDVDVIFVYGGEGNLTPALSNHQFYTKLAEEIIRAVGASSEEGNIFRIDLRLRPEGATGPLVRSLESCENYYAEWGETWERMALIKARSIAGDARLGEQFVQMVQPFVFARHAGENIIQQMAALKQRIEKEIVGESGLTRHVKLGIGGIREIEFIVQSFQVLRGARVPALRERNTLRALAALTKAKCLTAAEAGTLADAYRFLRNVEHRLQMEMELQTHTIPDEERALYRLARSLGFANVEKFFAVQQAHTASVREIYRGVLANAEQIAAPTLPLTEEQLPGVLAAVGFRDVPAAAKLIEGLLQGSGFVHISQRTMELFARLFPILMEWSKRVADPDAALLRFDKFVNSYGSRGLLYEMFVRTPKLVEMLMRLGDASKFLSETMARQPELFDEICDGAVLSEPKNLDRLYAELKTALAAGDEPMEAARLWKRGEMLRIGVEDIMGLIDVEQLHLELTCLAEACLHIAVEQARAELNLEKFPFAVIGMGKFGGKEIGYGADLDVMFIGGKTATDQTQATKLAQRVLEFMTQQTVAGSLFAMDARLRPDGEKGPLASSLDAHRDYYAKRAQLWERQALIKSRFVGGDATLGKRFAEMACAAVYSRALSDNELEEIRGMRRRIETERGDPHHPELEFKTGAGGLMDVEFLVQALQLRHGHVHAQLRTAHTLAGLNRLTAIAALEEEESSQLRHHYLFLRKIESVLRRVENSNISRLPADESEQRALALRLGFSGTAEFWAAYPAARAAIRTIYERRLPGSAGSAATVGAY
jgi:glutamate-ammonia-ligase adenylyltransferase